MTPYSSLDPDEFLNQTFYGLDILAMLGDMEDFINFSESNIYWQRRRELRRAKQECNEIRFDDSHFAFQYHDHRIEGVSYRFDVSLAQRVRYSALTLLITTIEWAIISIKNRFTFPVPKKPDGKNEAIHLLEVFNQLGSLGIESQIKTLESLTQVRNCIVHAAGLVAYYKHGPALRQTVSELSGINISNMAFLGDCINIERDYLQHIVGNTKQWLPNMLKIMYEKGLLHQ